jgi:hypothetical protein
MHEGEFVLDPVERETGDFVAEGVVADFAIGLAYS